MDFAEILRLLGLGQPASLQDASGQRPPSGQFAPRGINDLELEHAAWERHMRDQFNQLERQRAKPRT